MTEQERYLGFEVPERFWEAWAISYAIQDQSFTHHLDPKYFVKSAGYWPEIAMRTILILQGPLPTNVERAAFIDTKRAEFHKRFLRSIVGEPRSSTAPSAKTRQENTAALLAELALSFNTPEGEE